MARTQPEFNTYIAHMLFYYVHYLQTFKKKGRKPGKTISMLMDIGPFATYKSPVCHGSQPPLGVCVMLVFVVVVVEPGSDAGGRCWCG